MHEIMNIKNNVDKEKSL